MCNSITHTHTFFFFFLFFRDSRAAQFYFPQLTTTEQTMWTLIPQQQQRHKMKPDQTAAESNALGKDT